MKAKPMRNADEMGAGHAAAARRRLAFAAIGGGALLLAYQMRRYRRAYDFSGKAVLITGGSRGLGLVMARQLASGGARVAIIARDADELTRAVAEIRDTYPTADVITITADVRDSADADRAVTRVVEHFGGIDVLINNAGIVQVGPFDHQHAEDYEDAMRTHFWGPFYMVHAALPHMRRQAHGRIVNISSIGGRIAVPHMLPYSTSKFALAGFSDGLRVELARDNIVVTSVYPGLMRTGSPVNALFKGQRPQEYAWFAISDSLPLTSINAERAGTQIIDACRFGDAELVITVQAKLAILARTLAPELFSTILTMVNSLLPDPARQDGDEPRPGREAESDAAGPASLLTAATYAAAAKNNEL